MPSIEIADLEEEFRVLGKGEMDLTIGKEFENALKDGFASGKPVVVDLLQAEYIDSAILAALARYGVAMVDRGERLKVIVAAKGHPEDVLKTVGFNQIMDIAAEKRG